MRVVLFCVAARFVYYSLLPSHAVGANSPPPFARPSREKTLFCDGCACACVSGASYITLCLLPRPRRPPCRSMPAEGGRENCARGSGPSGRAAASSSRRGIISCLAFARGLPGEKKHHCCRACFPADRQSAHRAYSWRSRHVGRSYLRSGARSRLGGRMRLAGEAGRGGAGGRVAERGWLGEGLRHPRRLARARRSDGSRPCLRQRSLPSRTGVPGARGRRAQRPEKGCPSWPSRRGRKAAGEAHAPRGAGAGARAGTRAGQRGRGYRMRSQCGCGACAHSAGGVGGAGSARAGRRQGRHRCSSAAHCCALSVAAAAATWRWCS